MKKSTNIKRIAVVSAALLSFMPFVPIKADTIPTAQAGGIVIGTPAPTTTPTPKATTTPKPAATATPKATTTPKPSTPSATSSPKPTATVTPTPTKSNVHTIEYDTKGGTLSAGAIDHYTTDTSKTTVYKLPVATKNGYIFLGWYKSNGKRLNKLTSKNKTNFNLTAKWLKPTIKSSVKGYAIEKGTPTTLTIPKTLSLKGYKYLWYNNGAWIADTKKKATLDVTSKKTMSCGYTCQISYKAYGKNMITTTPVKTIVFYKKTVSMNLDAWTSTSTIFGSSVSISSWNITNIKGVEQSKWSSYIKTQPTRIGLRKYFEKANLTAVLDNGKKVKVIIKCKIPMSSPQIAVIRDGDAKPTYYRDGKKVWCRLTFNVQRTAGYKKGVIQYKYRKKGDIKGQWNITKNLSSSFIPGYTYYFRLKLNYGFGKVLTSEWIKVTISTPTKEY